MYFKYCMPIYRIHSGGVWSKVSQTERLYTDLLTLKCIYDVEWSYDLAKVIRYYMIKFCDKFDKTFIMSIKVFILSILCAVQVFCFFVSQMVHTWYHKSQRTRLFQVKNSHPQITPLVMMISTQVITKYMISRISLHPR